MLKRENENGRKVLQKSSIRLYILLESAIKERNKAIIGTECRL